MAQFKYYAVKKGRNSGIYKSWPEAKAQTDGYPGAIFKSFKDVASAKKYLNSATYQLPKRDRSKKTRIMEETSSNDDLNGKKDHVFTVYTDGSSLSNGQHNSKAGYGIHWPKFPDLDTSGAVTGEQTNNRGELTAIKKSLMQATNFLHKHDTLTIKADSEYSINCLGKWGDAWERNAWSRKTGGVIKNLELIRETRALMKSLRDMGITVNLEHVRGHSNEPGNERADELARLGAKR